MKINSVSIIGFFLWSFCYSQTSNLNLTKQHPDTIKNEMKELFIELGKKHPGFYRYNQKEEFDTFIDSTINTIQRPMNELGILRKVRPIISRIGCLHTSIRLSKKTKNTLNSLPNLLPFSLFYDQGKSIVWKVFDNTIPIKPGDVVVKINGKEIGEIYEILLSHIPMDGKNSTGKYKLLEYTFPIWYRNSIEITEKFEIELDDGKKYMLNGVKEEETLKYSDIVSEPVSLNILDDIALIKIPSFSNSYLQSKNQKFEKIIKSYIKTIEEKKVTKVLFDLHGNTGGSDSNPAWLSSLFFEENFRYWDRIEITEGFAKEITGLNRTFYGKPKYENGKWLWSDKGIASKEFKFTREQKPSKKRFKGTVYILTDGLCLSSCSDFVAIMQSNEKAKILGEETGGGYQGNTSGLIPSEQLNSGLIIDVPLLLYFNRVEKYKNLGRGTKPDIILRPAFDELSDDKIYLYRVIETIKRNY